MEGKLNDSIRLTADQIDVLAEILNIGIGQAANILNQMIQSHIKLSLPSVQLCSTDNLLKSINRPESEQFTFIRILFKGKISGTASLVLPMESASNLIAVITDEDIYSTDLDSIQSGTLAEIGNILLNGVMGSLGNMLAEQLLYSVPNYYKEVMHNFIDKIKKNDIVLVMRARFFVEEHTIDGDIIIIFEFEGYCKLIKSINNLISE
ncbi:MAG: chemotaxis protein CheC [Candidatus Hodarchaeales archaeon]|jgi:chemotaxis protein CheC